MTSQAVKLKVSASVARDCAFWAQDDGWAGVCEELSVTVHGSSFEDAKRRMAAALEDYVEKVLGKHSKTAAKKIA
jgi:hypothetical protein